MRFIYVRIIKPLGDFFASSILLLMASPAFILCFLGLFIANRGKVFFYQDRPGRGERIFKIIKFKSMNDKRGPGGELLPDEQRLTPMGKLVRKTSLDEIPQLINVLKGDMSMVGPRPLLVSYLELYNEEQRKRHWVKPGITGWAQINGRNAISWEEKFSHDVWYVENISFWLDMKILIKTIRRVIVREGISSATSATMEKFTGNTTKTDSDLS